MPFDWMKPYVNKEFCKKLKGRTDELGHNEIEQRARLLFSLNFSKAQVIKRISENIAWEYELSVLPAFHKDVKEIVECVFKREARCV